MSFVGNYLLNLPAVLLGRQPERPLMFSYYLTHRCNLNCVYCCDGDGRRFKENPIHELTTAESCRLLDLLRSEADTLDLTGGEPLVREDLEEVLKHAHAIGFRTVLNTKGLGIENRPDVLQHTDVLALSIDTLNVGTLARLIDRPLAAAQQILFSLYHLIKLPVSKRPLIVLTTVATPDNLDDVEQVLGLASKHRLGFQISPEIVGTRANEKLHQNARYRRLLQKCMKYKKESGVALGVPEYLRGIADFGDFPCYPLLMPVIRPDGALYYPCLESNQAEENILTAGSYTAALNQARARRGGIPPCRSCCHIFCHMALSLLQRHPISALGELKNWSRLNAV